MYPLLNEYDHDILKDLNQIRIASPKLRSILKCLPNPLVLLLQIQIRHMNLTQIDMTKICQFTVVLSQNILLMSTLMESLAPNHHNARDLYD